ncbi:MAG TPA: MmgE/PrpD family protein [Candidatus Acidoferrum sp.]|nr:MmgE/PrpD family protein [Candidatus Acidoferrum sp.]
MSVDAPPAITADLAAFVGGVAFDALPRQLVHVARRHILDTLGVMAAGGHEPPAQIALEHARILGGRRDELAAPLVAFVLGVRGHVLDYDDTQLATRPESVYGLLTHPSVPVFAAALAMGAASGANGAEVFAAFVAGTEAECRISDAIDPRHYQDGFHSSGTVGTLGATLAAARVLQLDEATTRVALGIGASSAAGLRENFGTMTKSLHVGRAAQHGVEAAYLARAGWTAAADILEARRGFFRAAGGGFDPGLIDGRLGNPWYYLDPGVSIKPNPSGSLTHPAMWVFAELVREHDLRPENVASVRVGTNSNHPNALIHHRPQDPLAAKFSMEYAMATLLARRRGGLAEYDDPAAVLDDDVQTLIPKIDFGVDPVAEAAGFHRMLARITVTTTDGRSFFGEGDAGRGHPANPMSDHEVVAKFTDCARWAGLVDDGAPLRALVDRLETLEDVRPLVAELGLAVAR